MLNIVDKDSVKSGVGHLKEMEERFNIEEVLSIDPERILLHETISTQHLCVDRMIRICSEISTGFQLFFFVP